MNNKKGEFKNPILKGKHDENQLSYYDNSKFSTVVSLRTSASLETFINSEVARFDSYQWTKKYKNTPYICFISSVSDNFEITGFGRSGSFISTEWKYDFITCASGSQISYHYAGLWTQEELDKQFTVRIIL